MDNLKELRHALEKRFPVKSFETEKGSIYTLLKDGRFQRYKTVEKSLREPHDITVFIPDYDTLLRACPKKVDIKKFVGNNKGEYDSRILRLIHSGYKIHLINQKGKILGNPEDISKADGQLYLAFEHKGNVDLYLPVSAAPKVGWSTYQVTKKDLGEKTETRTHLGHKVNKIVYNNGKVES